LKQAPKVGLATPPQKLLRAPKACGKLSATPCGHHEVAGLRNFSGHSGRRLLRRAGVVGGN